MLNPKFKAKWIAALRSGEFTQTHHNLKDKFGLCCIGVGYVVCTGMKPTFKQTRPAAFVIGLSEDEQQELVDLNDTHCKKFPEIADWIEKNL